LGDIGFKPSYWSSLQYKVNQNLIKEEKLNESAERIISTLYKFGQMENFPKTENFDVNYITEETKQLNRRAATESIVLLKNDDNILPINLKKIESMNKKYKIGILGIDAFKGDFYGQEGSIILTVLRGIKLDGHIVNGIGSSQTDMNYVVVPIDAIKAKTEKCKNIELAPYAKLDKEDNEDIENSKNIAKDCDIILIFVQSISGEDMGKNLADRKDLNVMHNGNKLIEEISEINKNIVVIINAPGPVNLEWKDKVKSIIFGGLAGPESGNAIADIIFGDANPSGHLPFVWGKREQYPADVKELPNEFGMLKNGEK
jgi:beta-glucosidase